MVPLDTKQQKAQVGSSAVLPPRAAQHSTAPASLGEPQPPRGAVALLMRLQEDPAHRVEPAVLEKGIHIQINKSEPVNMMIYIIIRLLL